MILDYNNEHDRQKGIERQKYALDNKKEIELRFLSQTRTSQQNRAIRKFFILIAAGLNEIGLEFQGQNILGEPFSTRFNEDITREFIWRPLQRTLFQTNSTTELNTYQINEIADVIIRHYGENYGIKLVFPSIKWKLDELNEK